MSSLLRRFIMEVVAEVQDHRVPNQLVPKGAKKQKSSEDKEEESEEEVDESVGAGAIAGFTGPLGASSADMGQNPTKPGQRLKKHKKRHVRWK